ncbi:MAG: hypothetical protein Q9223_001726 [Gallowayella weberi]
MPPPAKRRRLSALEKAHSERNADAELHEQRARSTRKSKSTFEAIFEKYSKDFTGIGDVIDFNTDTIIVNNGHVEHMLDEKDAGDNDQLSSDKKGGEEEDEDEEQDEEGHEVGDSDVEGNTEGNPEGEGDASLGDRTGSSRIERVIPDSQDIESSDDDPLSMLEDRISKVAARFRQGGGTKCFQSTDNLRRDDIASTLQPRTAPLRRHDDLGVEEAWRFPLLPQDMNMERQLPGPSPSLNSGSDFQRPASPTTESIWALPKRTRQSKTFGASVSHPTTGTSSKPVGAVQYPPWTQAEKTLLRQLRTLEMSWPEIHQRLPNRTMAAIRTFWSAQKNTTQSGKLPCTGSSYKSLKSVRNRHNSQAEQIVFDRPLQTITSDAIAASSHSENMDAEMEDDLVLAPEKSTGPNQSSSNDPKQRTLQQGTIVPDSQGTIEGDQLPDQVHYSQLQDEEVDIFPSVSTSMKTTSNPMLLGSSSEDAPDANDEYPQIPASGQYCQNMPSTAASVPARIHLQSKIHEISASHQQGPEVLIRAFDISRVEDTSQPLASIIQPPESVERPKTKPATNINLPNEALNSQYPTVKGFATGTNRVLDGTDIVMMEASGETPDVEISEIPTLRAKTHGGLVITSVADTFSNQRSDLETNPTTTRVPDGASTSQQYGDQSIPLSDGVSRPVSEARHIPIGVKDPQPGGLPPTKPTAADLVRGSRTAFQRFDRVEIPITRSTTSDAHPKEPSTVPGVPSSELSTVLDAPPRTLSAIPVTLPRDLARNPGTPPRELLPAQKESLRKIKPFSLILPTERNPMQSRSPYLQALNKKYRLNHGVIVPAIRSLSVRKDFDEQPARQSLMDPMLAMIGDQGYAEDGSTIVHGLEPNVSSLNSTAVERELSLAMEDEDDLQLPIQTTATLSLQSKRHLVDSGIKQQVPLRPRILDMDISDDELATPI